MKLVIATPLYPPEIGGPATYVKILEAELPKHGIEVAVVKFSEVRHLPKIVRHYQYYRLVREAARSADVVLALDPVSVGFPALWAARSTKKKFVVKIVGDYAWEQGRARLGITEPLDEFLLKRRWGLVEVSLLQMIQAYVARSAEKVIVPSEYLRNVVLRWSKPKPNVKVIYNAVPVEELGNVPQAVVALSRPIAVTAGRFVPWKHFDGVIDAVEAIQDLSLVVVGDGPERPTLEKYAKEQLGDRAVITGVLSHADLLATIKYADVFVLNSSYEGLSHVLVEATLLGVPVVVTDAGGNSEVVTNGSNGTIVPVGDAPALIKALRERKASTGSLADKFSVETMITRTADLLTSL